MATSISSEAQNNHGWTNGQNKTDVEPFFIELIFPKVRNDLGEMLFSRLLFKIDS